MFLADLHIHSRYSRATSRDCDAPHLDVWARRKGLALIGTGDFTHPGWRAELADALTPAEDGLYRLKDELRLPCEVADAPAPRFVVSGEISTIYKSGGKTRKVHHVILLRGWTRRKRSPIGWKPSATFTATGDPFWGWTAATCSPSRWKPARTPFSSPRISGRRISPCSARSRTSAALRNATAI